jgi:hypothetical protein
MTGRIGAALHRGAFRSGLFVLSLPFRVAMLAGLFRVVATVAFLLWAVPIVGLRPAGWLAAIAWVHRLTRHKRAAMYRHEITRRAERAMEQQTRALAKSARSRLPLPRLPRLRRREVSSAAERPIPEVPPSPAPKAAAKTSSAPKPAAPMPPGLEPILPRWLGGGRWRRRQP